MEPEPAAPASSGPQEAAPASSTTPASRPSAASAADGGERRAALKRRLEAAQLNLAQAKAAYARVAPGAPADGAARLLRVRAVPHDAGPSIAAWLPTLSCSIQGR